ncbi:MAG: DNA recombination protein RmuC [Rhodomicrobium sp.]
MTITMLGVLVAVLFSGFAALFSLLNFLRAGRRDNETGLIEQFAAKVRAEGELIRRNGDEQARNLRQELTDTSIRFQDTTLNVFRDLGDGLGSKIKDFGAVLEAGVKMIGDKSDAIGTKLDQETTRMGEDATRNRDALRETIEIKLADSATKQATAGKELREEMTGSFHRLGTNVAETLEKLGEHQKERLDNVTTAVGTLTEKHERAQDALKQAVENRLDAIRTENTSKLEEMRQTVDEKLQSTLETRLGESFNRVVEHLERVHKGIGEMQSLAADVGNLKNVLTNVRVRGTFGEIQLETLLVQFLAPDQFIKNAQVKEHSQERVEFAIKLPGRDAEGEVLLPVDAKFPKEDYERLVAASEVGDKEAVLQAGRDLEQNIRQRAKSIRDKYIAPPRTTEFAILFLPTESLYAEVLRRRGFFEQLQQEFHVTLTGPTTFSALLNALHMGFQTLAIEQRSGEVWKILGAVRNEFGKYNDVVDGLSKQLNTAARSVEKLGVRTRAMNKKLRDVEKLPDDTAQILLGPSFADTEEAEDQEEVLSESVSPPLPLGAA